ncbi:MAG: 2-succinyl-6-hydroxy-2,4-cyclohexadiene-1-carboxylate synthase [Candidatus Binatia bacterium]
MTRITVNGISLNIECSGTGPALLLLHGFTGSHMTWTPHLNAWQGFSLITVDLLGHGHSDFPADPDHYQMGRCIEDLVALLDALEMPRVALLGYSMGGRVALHLALHAPQRLWALILESASPGIADAAARAARVQSDAALAAFIEQEGITAFVDRWQALPLFATQAQLSLAVREALRRQRLDNHPQGLANSLRGLGAGQQEPVLSRLAEMGVPTLLLAGALDTAYCEHARRMTAVLLCGQLVIVPDAGHAVHLEQPVLFADAVRTFLTEYQQSQLC